MNKAGSPTVREAQAQFYLANDLSRDGGSNAQYWAIELAGLSLPLPNFTWRQKALPIHDLHHLLTGYPCSPAGEFEMAAWEFAAGRYRNMFATAFCLPLVGIGALVCPQRTFNAFVRGKASRTLYAHGGLPPAMLDSPLDDLRQTLLPASPPRTRVRDGLAYAGLAIASLAWTMAPFAVALAWALWQ